MCCCVWVAPSLGVGRTEVLADRSPKLLGMMVDLRGEVRFLFFFVTSSSICARP